VTPQVVRRSGPSLVTIQLCGSAAGLSYLHARFVVHGSGKSEKDLTSIHDLTFYVVKCVSSSYSSVKLCRLKARRKTFLSLARYIPRSCPVNGSGADHTLVRANRRFATLELQRSLKKSATTRSQRRCHPEILSGIQPPSSSETAMPPQRHTLTHTHSRC